VFQQGTAVNAHDAAYSTATNCANQGLNVALDLAGKAALWRASESGFEGHYYIMSDKQTTTCSGGGGLLGSLSVAYSA